MVRRGYLPNPGRRGLGGTLEPRWPRLRYPKGPSWWPATAGPGTTTRSSTWSRPASPSWAPRSSPSATERSSSRTPTPGWRATSCGWWACTSSPYEQADGFGGHEPERPRKLLLHRDEIDEFGGRMQREVLSLVPLSVYFKDGKAKVELALARGRKSLRQAGGHGRARRQPRHRAGHQHPGLRGAGRKGHAGAFCRLNSLQVNGGAWFRPRATKWEKRAVVPGAT